MAIKLKVQDTNATFKLRGGEPVRFKFIQGGAVLPDAYQGPYTATPTEETQTLQTHGLMMDHDVTINPIPTNYGRITWNGSVLTVS